MTSGFTFLSGSQAESNVKINQDLSIEIIIYSKENPTPAML
jgi:hypothetical protein